MPRSAFLALGAPVLLGMIVLLGTITGSAGGAMAQQAVEFRQWRGTTAQTQQPEQVLAGTMAEWRSLWSRVGVQAPDHFEPGRMTAVGIFLGLRAGTGYFVNLISSTRRRDRIIVVFEERAPEAVMLAERSARPPPPPPRPVAGGLGFGGGPANSFVPPGSAMALSAAPPASRAPMSPPTSPWAIVLIPRADLPITVEQRLFR